MEAPRREHQAELRALRRDALHLRRAAWPLRDVLAALLRDESGLIEESTRLFLRDAYDHAVQVVDVVESFRDALASLSDLYVSTSATRPTR
jgi:magnesium transporter